MRTATLAYDAVALAAALTKTQGPARFSEAMLTNASGFTGIDGLFRFRPDGTNQRGLAVMRVRPPAGRSSARRRGRSARRDLEPALRMPLKCMACRDPAKNQTARPI